MVSLQHSQKPLTTQQRRAIFRAWHRGLKEMDLILGQYIDAHVTQLTEAQFHQFEQILEIHDRDLLAWVTGECPIPTDCDWPILHDIIDYRKKIDFS